MEDCGYVSFMEACLVGLAFIGDKLLDKSYLTQRTQKLFMVNINVLTRCASEIDVFADNMYTYVNNKYFSVCDNTQKSHTVDVNIHNYLFYNCVL